MKKYDPLWHDINNLLSILRHVDAVERVNDYYLHFSNVAPGLIMQREMDKLQEKLDEAESQL